MRRNSFPLRHPSQHEDIKSSAYLPQTHRQTDRQTETKTLRQRHRQTHRHRDKHAENPVEIDEAGSLALAQFLQEVVADSAQVEDLDEKFQCDKYKRRVELCVHLLKSVVPQLCPRLVSTQRTFSVLSSYLCTALYSNQEET
jgi:hypothetical protein